MGTKVIPSPCWNIEYIIASTSQLYQFIGECRSCHTLSLIIEELFLTAMLWLF
jgi:hypothetical protein